MLNCMNCTNFLHLNTHDVRDGSRVGTQNAYKFELQWQNFKPVNFNSKMSEQQQNIRTNLFEKGIMNFFVDIVNQTFYFTKYRCQCDLTNFAEIYPPELRVFKLSGKKFIHHNSKYYIIRMVSFACTFLHCSRRKSFQKGLK